ncbi:uncharacterized protein RAG0_17271 [Rhynchosporium agropyri]|uniref:Uncharacterized protein n=1 Tax=Rhynchosporium agropyri TaxID=914238 RepID=A0A1E1LTJ2_9HELO|nr:uncharacterized protein RAG0_17271 [Rhynchosporium agropyri]
MYQPSRNFHGSIGRKNGNLFLSLKYMLSSNIKCAKHVWGYRDNKVSFRLDRIAWDSTSSFTLPPVTLSKLRGGYNLPRVLPFDADAGEYESITLENTERENAYADIS